MKKFLKKVVLFITVPAICLLLAEILLPPTFFTHRTWEALSFQSMVPRRSYFYPNVKSEMNAVGDLCHHTDNAIIKKELWINDKLGFRNDQFIENPDVLFLGDSFIAGSSLSQDETISSRVQSAFNGDVKVYNMAPATFSAVDYYLKEGVLKKPKLIIYSISERNVPERIQHYDNKKFSLKNTFKELFETGNVNVLIDKALKCTSIKWLKARVHRIKGSGVPAQGDENMFFYSGKAQNHTSDDLQEAARVIISYKKYCDSLGAEFIFMPMPDKETVYYELVPFKEQPAYLHRLDSMLTIAGIRTIHTLDIYNDYRKTSRRLLYHLDDTHWNPNATALITREIVRKLSSNTQSLAVKRLPD